ncbi:hypothetical protein A1OE_803 [Candidatus Endolissoclinum faulkneri L2]|uniref:Uncharacterized protein n=1 Tax=Candidatus Endolissoclinum faulkneri L2 TaxID=1193729 RepID=K7Z4Q6_9PROT|nr:hypothetical protein A1OE_803 [Candidatus Endolissoclinum faulkneri L2]
MNHSLYLALLVVLNYIKGGAYLKHAFNHSISSEDLNR